MMMFFFSKETNLNFPQKSIESAYIAILNKELLKAKEIFESIDNPRASWGVALTNILLGYISKYPTYFEIRNFLEIDLDFLIKNELIEYVELVLGALEILSSYNQEVYKYVARVMYENKFYKACREYLDKSKSIFFNDPELHFIYAKYYIKIREYELAENHLEECLKILPDYYPAKILVKEISRYLA